MVKPFLKLSKIYPIFFSEKRKIQFEKLIFWVAIFTFIAHLLLVVLVSSGLLRQSFLGDSVYLNPLKSIYTPFTIILLYEIYALIYYLPKSITMYLAKQYEVITLILVRKLFYHLAVLSGSSENLTFTDVKEILLIFAGLLILLLLIFCFYKLSGNKYLRTEFECISREQRTFVAVKKVLALILMALFIFLFVKSFFDMQEISVTVSDIVYIFSTINKKFFNVFFTALILTEVLLLLFTFSLSDKFSKVIRNCGFIISTTLLKLSFNAEGLADIGITLASVAFGVAVLGIYKLYEKKIPDACE